MAKKKREEPPPQLVAPEVWKEIQSFRPLRLFIKKQKKKGNEGAPLKLRAEFLQASTEKQVKYFQKAIDKYIQLLDDQDISERVQIEGRLFDNLLSRTEQRAYFESLEAPKKPPVSVVSYYRDHNKQQGVDNPKGWATLTPMEKKPFVDMLHEAKADFSTQVKNFAENLPDRIKAEYISYINTTGAQPQSDSEKETPAPVKQRRKSVQPVPESFQSPDNDGDQKLTRTELDDLHKYLPSVLYYERKVPDDEKPTFPNTMAKNTHIRSVFNQLSDKKRHKFIVKAGKLWGEFLAEHADIVEKQVPTLHKLLSKKEDIHYYFTALGLPARPASSALILFNNERPANGSQQNWMDQSQATKDEYIKRLPKIKAEYHQALVNFVEKTLPSDYVRLEFFRNIKFASKDYEAATKDRVQDKDEGQLKITQYLKPKGRASSQDASEFERIKQQLLATKLTSEQSKLVERLGQLMKKYVEETTATKASAAKPITAHRASTNSGDVILVNGDHSADDVASAPKKGKKKRKHAVDEPSGSSTAGNDPGKSNATSSSSKKRK